MSNKLLKQSMESFLKMLCRSARNHKQGLHHYTTMSAFVRMLDSEKAYFSLLRTSNDGGEYKSDRHYMMCFSYGKEENIGLWGIYGIPRDESICLTFPSKEIMDWLASAKNDEIEFFGVEDRRRTVLLKDVCPNVSICDVAYYGGNVFTHREKNFRVVGGRQTGIEPCQDPRLAPYVKKWAWSYEHEVRIVLEFDKPVLNSRGEPCERIAVDFDEPLQALRSGAGKIILGPWFRRSANTIRNRGFSKANIVPSEFTGMISLRTPCFECEDKRRKSCKCKHKKSMA